MAKVTLGSVSKLGSRVAATSQEVGRTCPPTCPLLGKLCYADAIQRLRPNVKKAWAENVVDWDHSPLDHWRSVFAQLRAWEIDDKLDAYRVFVGGDWFLDGVFDRINVLAFVDQLEDFRLDGYEAPVWFYTHAWDHFTDNMVRVLKSFNCQVFASVHNAAEARLAMAKGFRLAGGDPTEKPRRGKYAERPVKFERWGQEFYTCPNQRKDVDCEKCRLCFSDNDKNVWFWNHS